MGEWRDSSAPMLPVFSSSPSRLPSPPSSILPAAPHWGAQSLSLVLTALALAADHSRAVVLAGASLLPPGLPDGLNKSSQRQWLVWMEFEGVIPLDFFFLATAGGAQDLETIWEARMEPGQANACSTITP